MSDFIITDQVTGHEIQLTFAEFYDLRIGLKCAADVFKEADNSERSDELTALNLRLI
jgi:hypothetical protein